MVLEQLDICRLKKRSDVSIIAEQGQSLVSPLEVTSWTTNSNRIPCSTNTSEICALRHVKVGGSVRAG